MLFAQRIALEVGCGRARTDGDDADIVRRQFDAPVVFDDSRHHRGDSRRVAHIGRQRDGPVSLAAQFRSECFQIIGRTRGERKPCAGHTGQVFVVTHQMYLPLALRP
ncbi:MAG: hypothetical protein M1434_11285 [Chloroflexi bacterium]|nr:hypothetical protein [Chloroflexota bacterium]MCL5275307.1 hypothetical protein [Chloroflexota bacterium]